MTITEFLTARLDEDEAAGCGCETNEAGDIRCHRCGERVNVECWNCRTPRGSGPCPTPRSARVFADIAAKRSIVALHSAPDGKDPSCSSIVYPERAEDCETLRNLAQPYAEHPDFDESWKP